MSGTLKPLFTWRGAICESDLTATTRHVAITLSLHANERGGSIHPGPACLAGETGLHVSTVKERLAELERKGWIKCVERGGRKGEKRRANAYELTIPDPTLLDAEPVATDYPSSGATRSRGSSDPSPTAEIPVAVGDPNSSVNSSVNSPSTPATVDLDFERWWDRYPRKVDKAKARERYRARRRQGVTAEQLVTARDAYARSVAGVEARFVKHAAVFLHGADGPWSEWVDGAPEGAAGAPVDPLGATRALIEAGAL